MPKQMTPMPATGAWMLAVQKRVEEMLYAYHQSLKRQDEAAAKPDAAELREAHDAVMNETDPAAFVAAMQVFVARYGQEAFDVATQRALARQRRDEGEAY